MAETLESRSRAVLLVDDDPDIRAMYASRLVADGFQVHVAANGWEAMAAARRPLGLILLDVRMPGMDGLEVLCQLKTGAEVVEAPVVMLTNESNASVAAACQTMGAVAWWSKSGLAPAVLCRRVREMMEP